MKSNPTTLSVDEQIAKMLITSYLQMSDKTSTAKILTDNIKSLIKEICEEVIGTDELQGMMSPLQWEVAQDRNYLRSEQRTKLNKILEKGEL